MDACGYCDLLHPDECGTDMEKNGRIVDMVDDETQTLEEGKRDPEIQTRATITKNGKAAHCGNDCPFLCEIVFNSDSELVFSLRSKQRFRKAHLEAAR